MSRARHFSAFRVTIFLLLVAGIFVWDGSNKIPAGPAEGDALPGVGIATGPRPGATLRIATFNIDGGAEGLDNVARVIKGFDLVGLQEVHGQDQTDTLSGDMGRLYAPVETQWWYKTFGNAALADLTVYHWERIPISANDSDSNRNVILLHTTFAGEPLQVMITHIDRQADHGPEVRMVAHMFLGLQTPAILMGDFNGKDGDPDVAALASIPGVIDPIGKGYDRIFARGFTATSSGTIDEHASDHPLAWANLQLSAPAITSPPSTAPPATSPAQSALTATAPAP